MNDLVYRKAVESDLPFLLVLRKDTMEKHLIRAGISTSEEEHLKRITYQFDQIKIIERKGECIGQIKTQEKEKHIEIIQIQVLSRFQGQGIGKYVIESLLQVASKKHKILSLSVLKGNKAINLYKKIGFQVVGETEDSFVLETPSSLV